jgi:phosphohistidine phosphatase SixA
VKALVVALVVALSAASAHAEKAVLLVRHAEKVDASKDAALSDAGKARALRLRDLLKNAGVTHVFTSEFVRTKDTAAPAAGKLVPVVVPAKDEAAVVLVVGHSNTVPNLVKALSGATVTIGDDDFGRVFVVTKSGVIELAY